MERSYPAIISQDTPEGPFGVTFIDFPGCVVVEDTESDAMTAARAALQGHVDEMGVDGESLPQPSPLAALSSIRSEPDVVAIGLVPVQVPGRSVCVNITLDEGLLARLDAAAAQHGTSRSGFLAGLVNRSLP